MVNMLKVFRQFSAHIFTITWKNGRKSVPFEVCKWITRYTCNIILIGYNIIIMRMCMCLYIIKYVYYYYGEGFRGRLHRANVQRRVTSRRYTGCFYNVSWPININNKSQKYKLIKIIKTLYGNFCPKKLYFKTIQIHLLE